jgi:hypothetical protein
MFHFNFPWNFHVDPWLSLIFQVSLSFLGAEKR